MSDFSRLEDDAPARRIVYIGALLLIAVPLVQVGSQIWPLQLSNIQWRFTAANSLSAVLLLPFLGATLMFLTARATESRGLSRVIGALVGLFAVGLVASTVLFVLDGLQLKTIVQSRQMDQFNIAMARVGVLSLVFSVAYAMLAFACFRGPRAARATTAKAGSTGSSSRSGSSKNDDAVTLIVGQSAKVE